MMNDLIAFLRAREKEREDAALAVKEAMQSAFPPDEFTVRYAWATLTEHRSGGKGSGIEDGAPSPDWVLRDVAAKRKVVDEHQPERPDLQQYESQTCAICFYDNSEAELYPCPTLRHLASVWSDHPDYDARWAP